MFKNHALLQYLDHLAVETPFQLDHSTLIIATLVPFQT